MNTFNKITVDRLYDEIDKAATKAMPLFTLYGWSYLDSTKPPTLNELKSHITSLAEAAIESFYGSKEHNRSTKVSSGRISISINDFEDSIEVSIGLDLGEKQWYKAQPKIEQPKNQLCKHHSDGLRSGKGCFTIDIDRLNGIRK